MKQNTQNVTYITIIHKRYLYKMKQKHTKHKKIYTIVQNKKKRNEKNVINETII